jgi:NADH-quinone oxidoreductase subunit I
MRIWGKGLLDGLRVTLHNLTHRSVTAQYPDVKPELPVRSRGVIALQEENCTSCMLCARECPSWCIYVDSRKETIPATSEGGRDRQQNVLDRFDIDYSLCMYCGICVDVCPFDALHWSPEFEYATTDIGSLTHDKSELREWLWTVPPPAAIEPGRLLPIVEAAPVANGPSAAAQPPAPGGARDRAADPPVASGEAAGGAEGPEATSPEGGDA